MSNTKGAFLMATKTYKSEIAPQLWYLTPEQRKIVTDLYMEKGEWPNPKVTRAKMAQVVDKATKPSEHEAINKLITDAVEATHALYPDKAKYYSQEAVDKLILEGRKDELVLAGQHLQFKNPNYAIDRIAQLDAELNHE